MIINMADERVEKPTDEDKENFWKEILNEVSAQATRRLSSNKRILVLGDDCCGKTNLISKLRTPGEEEIKKGAGLEYTYLDIHDEERDEHTRLSVWIQDGNDQYKKLLNYVFTKESVKDLLILICVDMAKPWDIMENLEKWSRILHEHLHSLQVSAKELNEMEREMVTRYQRYKSFDGTNEDKKKPNPTPEDEVMPLDENILVNNMGIPIIIVVTKSDYMNVLETELEYREEHFDFIQKHLRQFCLKCGAALIYTSSKETSNTSLLYKYLLHQIYDFQLHIQPQVIEKDAIFIPMGWDNTSKISIVNEHIKTFNPDDPLQEHIIKPVSRKPISQEKEVNVDDEQTFLESQLAILNKAPAPPSSSSQRNTTQQPMEHRSAQRAPSSSPGQRNTQRSGIPNPKAKIDPSKSASAAQNSSETVLANFFNSLLNKNTGKGSKAAAPANVSNRGDVQAELERMSKKPTRKDGNS